MIHTRINPSTFTSNVMRTYNHNQNPVNIPHQGSLCRVVSDEDFEPTYVIKICASLSDNNTSQMIDASSFYPSTTPSTAEPSWLEHELVFSRHDFEFASRVFAILDSESTSRVHKDVILDFVQRRCPVFWRRDDDMLRLNLNYTNARDKLRDQFQENNSPSARAANRKSVSTTFDEIWVAVISCCLGNKERNQNVNNSQQPVKYLGLEGWMVFFRFIALAQYLEAKRRFSARHLQQIMRRKKNATRDSEMIMIDVPPAEPPTPLTLLQLSKYEQNSKSRLPAPELDLDHSLLSAHDCNMINNNTNNDLCGGKQYRNGAVKISLFGTNTSSNASTPSHQVGINGLEFALTYYCHGTNNTASMSASAVPDEVVVRRSMADMKWLNETFSSHKVLGGTLCGRILPPFPGSSSHSKFLSGHFHDDSASSILPSISIKNTTGSAINVATAGVGRIRDVAKSFMGSYRSSSHSSTSMKDDTPSYNSSTGTSVPQRSSTSTRKHSSSKAKQSLYVSLPESYYNPSSPAGIAQQLERYLNYLLEHPALSKSFPLNTILQASQSGVVAAKECIEECSRASREIQEQAPQLVDGKVGMPFWSHGSSFAPNSPSFAWVRTAAQAAIALKVHGMLETSGLPFSSARLQHASLPSFGNVSSRGNSGWEDIDVDVGKRMSIAAGASDTACPSSNFEEGVINDDGFDLLPLPVPAPERRILSAGSTERNYSSSNDKHCEARFHYGAPSLEGRYSIDDDEDFGSAYLGDILVDENIDKLREVIGSVDNTLTRCLASGGRIGKAHQERLNLHLNIVGGLDSWAGMRGKFVSQRSLLKGVSGIEQSKCIFEESDLELIDDLSWQTCLASSAVSAAEDVRAAVRASRTASNARATASSAALSAQQACEKGEFATMEDARAAQTRASIAQSHAIHAAVVEHEAKTVKRRATLALAHDVKTWNIHRKREMLRSCITYAKSQHEANRRAVDSWSSLADGFIFATMAPTTVNRKHNATGATTRSDRRHIHEEPEDARAVFLDDLNPSIIAVEHNALSSVPKDFTIMDYSKFAEAQQPEIFLPFAEVTPNPDFCDTHRNNVQSSLDLQAGSESLRVSRNGLLLPLVDVDSVPENNCMIVQPSNSIDPFDFSHFGIFDEESDNVSVQATPVKSTKHVNFDDDTFGDLIDFRRTGSRYESTPPNTNDDCLSESMHSLVEGLMNWGGGFNAEEKYFALPAGMATTIALEGSGLAEKSLI